MTAARSSFKDGVIVGLIAYAAVAAFYAAFDLLAARGIENVILCGVHLNMCVLGRPFAIRQQTYLGLKVALMRDMTDTMYNPERPPGVDHFTGTDLVVAHVERHWCPSFTSTDLTGRLAFRFQEDKR